MPPLSFVDGPLAIGVFPPSVLISPKSQFNRHNMAATSHGSDRQTWVEVWLG